MQKITTGVEYYIVIVTILLSVAQITIAQRQVRQLPAKPFSGYKVYLEPGSDTANYIMEKLVGNDVGYSDFEYLFVIVFEKDNGLYYLAPGDLLMFKAKRVGNSNEAAKLAKEYIYPFDDAEAKDGKINAKIQSMIGNKRVSTIPMVKTVISQSPFWTSPDSNVFKPLRDYYKIQLKESNIKYIREPEIEKIPVHNYPFLYYLKGSSYSINSMDSISLIYPRNRYSDPLLFSKRLFGLTKKPISVFQRYGKETTDSVYIETSSTLQNIQSFVEPLTYKYGKSLFTPTVKQTINYEYKSERSKFSFFSEFDVEKKEIILINADGSKSRVATQVAYVMKDSIKGNMYILDEGLDAGNIHIGEGPGRNTNDLYKYGLVALSVLLWSVSLL